MRIITLFIFWLSVFQAWSQDYGPMQMDILSDTTRFRSQLDYLAHIHPNDTTCRNDLARAKAMRTDSLGFFVWNRAFGPTLRYEEELLTITKQLGLKWIYRWASDVLYENQTIGCDKVFMDNLLFEKYGINFKTKIYNQADSLFLVHHLDGTLLAWDCDIEPEPLDSPLYSSSISIKTNLDLKGKKYKIKLSGYPDRTSTIYPSATILFKIDKSGDVSDFRMTDFLYVVRKNMRYRQQLLDLAINEIKKQYPHWTPAKIRGTEVNSSYVMSVHFSKE